MDWGISLDTIITVATYITTTAYFWGAMHTRLGHVEKNQEEQKEAIRDLRKDLQAALDNRVTSLETRCVVLEERLRHWGHPEFEGAGGARAVSGEVR